jgi:O-acetyl-ADP-ribose deacetylase (regulator of RNase III)
MLETKIKDTVVRVEKGDLTAMAIESIVHYASPDLVLGSGFGSAIAARGGASIQEELKSVGTIATGKSVVTSAGALNSQYLVHAVGPRFQEDDTEQKLEMTMQSALNAAKEKGIQKIAFPPMGTGFYGVPLTLCARIMFQSIKDHINTSTSLNEIIVCVLDEREFKAFREEWKIIAEEGGNQ